MPQQILFRFLSCIFLVLVLVSLLPAVVSSEELPLNFVGICTGERVNVRAGADLNFEVLTQINRGDKVIVLGKTHGWLKIKIPVTTDCFVHTDYLKLEGDKKGKITGERVNVRAGAGTNYSILGQLNKGDIVQVRAVKGEWASVIPPATCFAWVSSRYIKYYSTLEEFELEQKAERQRQDIFQKLEKDYRQQLSQPILEAEFSTLLKRYQEFLKKYPYSPEIEQVKKRIGSIKLKIAEKDYRYSQSKLEAKLKEVEEAQRRQRQAQVLPPPTAIGQIDDLGMIINRPGTHKLVDQGQVIYYLRSDKCNLNHYIYYPVRIWGKVINLPDWDKPVIEVEMIRPIE